MAQDITLAIIALLAGDPDILNMVGFDINGRARVYCEEMPRCAAQEQPRFAMVVRRTPGSPGEGGRLELERGVVEIVSFGPSVMEAGRLSRAAHNVLKYMEREVHENVLLHDFDLVSGAQSLRDAEAGWPLVRESWEFLASENEVET